MKASEREHIVDQIVNEIYEAYPFLWERFGENGRKRTKEDNYHHLDHLSTTYEMGEEQFFMDYTKWLQTVLTSRDVGTELIIDNYERLYRHLEGLEDHDEQKAYQSYLKNGIEFLRATNE
ncbi:MULTISPECIES: hypothetical protein [Pontibacillus]|uniref:Uncharacterized protein n=1 Tax=Pontibacillus chungwhensis TaxID=265426 RepID=A0ABY8UUV7_9BACI|nr:MULTISPECIES: hypothetical protein [Pontibacillus]MCD5325214.1 hypothetical protein [Pontibacillus sp. HN14]WIF97461.1 hypothetical protein QNI29_17255 [Pontibacillus chungwhensis]